MNRNKIIIFYIIGIIIIICLFIIVFNNYININRDISVVKNSYNNLSDNVDSYNNIRGELEVLFNNFRYDSFNLDISKYEDIFIRYDNVIKKIDYNIVNLDNRCNIKYNDKNVNKICSNYKIIYEKIINLYIGDLSYYNSVVSSYNEYSDGGVDFVNLLYDKYIDYNDDGIYDGKNDNN